MKFSICVEFLDKKLLVFTLLKSSRTNTSELINAKTNDYGNFGNFNPRAIVNTVRVWIYFFFFFST